MTPEQCFIVGLILLIALFAMYCAGGHDKK